MGQPIPRSLRRPKARVHINFNWCKKCGICAAFCPAGVFVPDEFGSPVLSRPEKCTACGLCVLRCPDFAIDLSGMGQT